jgi:hypothetical protein
MKINLMWLTLFFCHLGLASAHRTPDLELYLCEGDGDGESYTVLFTNIQHILPPEQKNKLLNELFKRNLDKLAGVALRTSQPSYIASFLSVLGSWLGVVRNQEQNNQSCNIHLVSHWLSNMHNLIENGADPNVASEPYQATLIHIMSGLGNIEYMDFLIDHGADPYQQDIFGHNAYDYVRRNNQNQAQYDVIAVFLDKYNKKAGPPH